jgi:hypothetical protein
MEWWAWVIIGVVIASAIYSRLDSRLFYYKNKCHDQTNEINKLQQKEVIILGIEKSVKELKESFEKQFAELKNEIKK